MIGRKSQWVMFAGFCFALAACGQSQEPAATPAPASTAETPAETKPAVASPPAVEIPPEQLAERRNTDLVAINAALKAYHDKNAAYPISQNQGFTGFGERGDNWIPELVPAFLPSLPRDPLMSPDPSIGYRYASDGKDYKLIVHGVPCDASVEKNGVHIDPARTKDGACWAYGFWTDGRAKF